MSGVNSKPSLIRLAFYYAEQSRNTPHAPWLLPLYSAIGYALVANNESATANPTQRRHSMAVSCGTLAAELNRYCTSDLGICPVDTAHNLLRLYRSIDSHLFGEIIGWGAAVEDDDDLLEEGGLSSGTRKRNHTNLGDDDSDEEFAALQQLTVAAAATNPLNRFAKPNNRGNLLPGVVSEGQHQFPPPLPQPQGGDPSASPSQGDGSSMQQSAQYVEHRLKAMLHMIHKVERLHHRPFFEALSVLVANLLQLESNQYGRVVTVCLAVNALLAVIFLMTRLITAIGDDAVSRMSLAVGLQMLLLPFVVSLATRTVASNEACRHFNLVPKAISLALSLTIPLTAAVMPPFVLHSRDVGAVMVYMMSLFRLANHHHWIILCGGLFSFVTLLSLFRGGGRVDAEYAMEVFEHILLGTIFIASSALFFSSRPSQKFEETYVHRFMFEPRRAANGVDDHNASLGFPSQHQQHRRSSGRGAVPASFINPHHQNSSIQASSQPQQQQLLGQHQKLLTQSADSNPMDDKGNGLQEKETYSLTDVIMHVAFEYDVPVVLKGVEGINTLVNGNQSNAVRMLQVLFSNITSLRMKELASLSYSGKVVVPATMIKPKAPVPSLFPVMLADMDATADPTASSLPPVTLQFEGTQFWCQEMQLLTPTSIAATRMESSGSGLQLLFTVENGIVVRFDTAGVTRLSLHLPIPANHGDETVLIVSDSVPTQMMLARMLWEQGVSTCVLSELPVVGAELSAKTFAGAILPLEIFLPDGLADEIDLPSVLPYAYIAALDPSATWQKGSPPRLSDRLHGVLLGLPCTKNARQYHQFLMQVRLRSATRYHLVRPTSFLNPEPMKKIGHGSVGTVHKVRLDDGSIAAMKVIRVRALSRHNISPDETFLEEQRKLILQHPHIVNVLHVERSSGPGGGEVIVFSELCSEVNLRCMLQVGALTPREAGKITYQLLMGLEYLHAKGSFAGDLKSENILFGSLRVVKIADYCSKMTTMNWRAPEFSNRSPETHEERMQADVWALGCVQLEMVFGKDYIPFTSATGFRAQDAAEGVAIYGDSSKAHTVEMHTSSIDAGSSRDSYAGITVQQAAASGDVPTKGDGAVDGGTAGDSAVPLWNSKTALADSLVGNTNVNRRNSHLASSSLRSSTNVQPAIAADLRIPTSDNAVALQLSSVSSVVGEGTRSMLQTNSAAQGITLPSHTPPDWREFIDLCLQVDPRRRPRVDRLLDHRFVVRHESYGETHSASSHKLSARQSAFEAKSQSSGGGGSSVNWPRVSEEE